MNGKTIKTNVMFKVLPFGHASIELKGTKHSEKQSKGKISYYAEPKTTSPEIVEISFGINNFSVPKTTAGFL